MDDSRAMRIQALREKGSRPLSRRESVGRIEADASLTPLEKDANTIEEHFRLLQACDKLSLPTCVAFDKPANLLHPLPLNDGGAAEVQVEPLGQRHFRLDPWPFAEPELTLRFPARHVAGEIFETSGALEQAFHAASVEELSQVQKVL